MLKSLKRQWIQKKAKEKNKTTERKKRNREQDES